ncbi:metal-dependent hydrolase [Tenacibaculum sp. SZ-18]|uniref:amidohydrolase n=1 Tax=Tenacibaculum sp. SZ-18 TaxID=754423 RepID=UPI000C2D2FD4|nr:amidohydrolase family protein [Tenacibaculum sp. SZ-18]AUC16287.1 metal-dependent hydrolase [Tenacibaculum sp. SZ-18]
MKTIFQLLFVATIFIGCREEKKESENYDKGLVKYYGGDIITMADSKNYMVEAVVSSYDKIVFVGSESEANKMYPKAKPHRLGRNTLMPGFIEPHVHPSLAATMLPNEIMAPYDWVLPGEVKKGIDGHDNYIKRLKEVVSKKGNKDQFFFIWGYHQLWHGDMSRELLNELAGDVPVGLIHRSFHEIFLNDAAIALLGIKKEDFKGNVQVDWERGHFFEGGWLALVPKMAPIMLEPNRYMKGLGIMSQLIQKNGITTIAEPGFPSSDFNGEYQLLKKLMDTKPPYDVYLIPSGTQLYGMKGGNKEAMSFMETLADTYDTENIHFLPKQVKLFSDGAIYSQLMQMKEAYEDGHNGEWMTPLPLFQKQISMYWENGYKIHVHSNGDKGIQQVLDYLEIDQKNKPRIDHRFTLHHMGYFSDEMAQQIADMGVEASVNPYYLWALADKYSSNGLGKARGEYLVRINSLAKRNIPTSYHSDFSMAPMEPLTLAWTAINRVTSQNSKLSQDQKVDVYTAMKAITIDAARTLNLENKIGSLEKGKKANFVILDSNPFKIDPIKIKDIKVKATIFEGDFNIIKSNNLKGGR